MSNIDMYKHNTPMFATFLQAKYRNINW